MDSNVAKREAAETCHIESLPDDLFLYVLRCAYGNPAGDFNEPVTLDKSLHSDRYFSAADVAECFGHALVSKRWRDLVSRVPAYIHTETSVSSSRFTEMMLRLQDVQQLIIDDRELNSLTDDTLLSVVLACPKLLRLTVAFTEGPVNCTEKGLSMALEACPRLQDLEMSLFPINRTPVTIAKLTKLVELKITSTAVDHLPEEIDLLHGLKVLMLDLPQLQSLPDAIGNLSNLEFLTVASCITSLPETLGQLHKLSRLYLFKCDSLTALSEAVGSCSSLTSITIQLTNLIRLPSNFGQLLKLVSFDCCCPSLTSLPPSLTQLSALEKLFSTADLTCLPRDIGRLSNLSSLELYRCPKLTHLPPSLAQAPLKLLHICICNQLASLLVLDLILSKLPRLQKLPDSVGQLQFLQSLKIKECDALEALPEPLLQLPSLTRVAISKCECIPSQPEGDQSESDESEGDESDSD